jgi:hypothetical protein
MGKPDVDEIEIAGAVTAIVREYGNVIGAGQARNIAYNALVGARFAKCEAEREASKKTVFQDHVDR